jgi:formylglycine-generating enzyme required for sulfatase activity
MRRWFLSYNSQDIALMQVVETALRHKDAEAYIFFAPKSLRAGGYWLPELAKEIAKATAFVLLVGEKGIGPWQVLEYYEALDRRVKEPDFPVFLVLLDGQPAPGLPFLRQLHWIVTANPASEQSLAKLIDAADGGGDRPSALWRHAAPFRGLAAMTEADSDFFFGRGRETVQVIRTLEAHPDKLPILLGNSGVGKSSLAQAGVMAALMRQGWPDDAADAGPWPVAFEHSRHWCFLTLQPGAEPVRALVEVFLDTWQFDAGDPARIKRRNEWIELLLDPGHKTTLSDLLDETRRRYKELNRSKPAAFFLYVDQGEELYVRAEPHQRGRFSELLARGLDDSRLRALMSIRSDFLGALQGDEPLFDARRQIDVPPLREAQLREVVRRPAAALSARFETETLADDIARHTAEESVKDAGALPLLSYVLDDMWTQMVQRGDGTLRLPAAAIELGGVLAQRANAFLASQPKSEDALRQLLTLKLATVREDGEPSRRRAWRTEFTDAEWQLVSELAGDPYRLLVIATPEGGETYAEVAHEAIFRRWEKLREWIAAEREFLAWRSSLEAARRAWQATPPAEKHDALLMGSALSTAQNWFTKRKQDLPRPDADFIALSVETQKKVLFHARRVRSLAYLLLAVIIGGSLVLMNEDAITARWIWYTRLQPYKTSHFRSYVLSADNERSLRPLTPFRECDRFYPEMVVVPSGKFLMGDSAAASDDDYQPSHGVTISRRFAIGKFPVTFEEWDLCVSLHGCKQQPADNGWGRSRRPVINVSAYDAGEYVTWLSMMTGGSYRLPSESEWEYAARAGTSTAYSFGNDEKTLSDYAWFRENSGNQTHPVGEKKPNPFGLYDMYGNVWEWVQDAYHPNYIGSPANGSSWGSEDAQFRVMRGGAANSYAYELQSYYRNKDPADNRYYGIGFRVARSLSN